jgi:trk system potassium uptake protein TrkA
VALFRDEEVAVPRGDTAIRAGDQLLVAASSSRMPEVEQRFSQTPEDMGTVVVAGGGATAVAVCRALPNTPLRQPAIARDPSRGQERAHTPPQAIILLGSATETALLKEEHVDQADRFLALTGDDETNVVASLLARDLGVPRVVTLVHRPDMLALCQRMGLGATLSPRLIAAERIIEYIDSGFNSNIATLADGKAEVFERVVRPGSQVAGRTLAEVELPQGALVVSVQRGDEIWVPHGGDVIEAGDLLVLFSSRAALPGVVAALEPETGADEA